MVGKPAYEVIGYKGVPGINLDPYERFGGLLKNIINERLKIDPNALDKFLIKITPDFAKTIILQAAFGWVNLPESIQTQLEELSKQNLEADVK